MSAPGSLACSKLLYPETEESHVKDVKDLELPPRFKNILCSKNPHLLSAKNAEFF